jgi:hypothetical protein
LSKISDVIFGPKKHQIRGGDTQCFLLNRYYQNDQVKDEYISRNGSMLGKEIDTKLWYENMKGREN